MTSHKNQKWSVDKYRTEYESDEHWTIRKAFMEKHKKKFGEGKIFFFAFLKFQFDLLKLLIF